MYEKSIDLITKIIDDAKVIVCNEKKKYDKLMVVIENFIHDNDIIVKEIKDYFFEVYTNDMFSLPNKLADVLYEYDPQTAKNVMVLIKIYKYHCKLNIDGITFVSFTYLNNEINNNIIEYRQKGYYTSHQLKFFGPEIQLINLYADLVNPNFIDSWPDLYKHEKEYTKDINNSLVKRINDLKFNDTDHKKNKKHNTADTTTNTSSDTTTDTTDTSSDSSSSSDYVGGATCKRSKYSNVNIQNYSKSKNVLYTELSDYYNIFSKKNMSKKIYASNVVTGDISKSSNKDLTISKIFNTFIDNDSHILIGPASVLLYTNKNIKISRIQIISKRSLNEEIDNIKKIFPDNLVYQIRNLLIPTNLNLYKLIVYVDKEPVLDIYNASTFELVPYNILSRNNNDIPVGSPLVILRFRLVDLWNTLYNIKYNNIKSNIGLSIVNRILEDYSTMRKMIDNMELSSIFPITYMGLYEDTQLSKERVTNRLKKRFIPPYIPQFSHKKIEID